VEPLVRVVLQTALGSQQGCEAFPSHFELVGKQLWQLPEVYVVPPSARPISPNCTLLSLAPKQTDGLLELNVDE
jgi:hypothetical protein